MTDKKDMNCTAEDCPNTATKTAVLMNNGREVELCDNHYLRAAKLLKCIADDFNELKKIGMGVDEVFSIDNLELPEQVLALKDKVMGKN